MPSVLALVLGRLFFYPRELPEMVVDTIHVITCPCEKAVGLLFLVIFFRGPQGTLSKVRSSTKNYYFAGAFQNG